METDFAELKAHLSSDDTERSRIVREIMRIHSHLLAIFTREVGVASSRLMVLRVLAVHHETGQIGTMEIARKLGINAAAVARQLADMERLGLVGRHPDADDKRRICLELTPKGWSLFARFHQRAHEFEESLNTQIKAHELTITLKVLKQLRLKLEEYR